MFEGNDIRDEKVVGFLKEPIVEYKFSGGESLAEVMWRTQEFLKEIIVRDDDKTYLISTHGCALRAMLNFLYENSDDYWHGHVPYNCCVNIVEAQNGVARLVTDDKIYYPKEMIVDRYKDTNLG